MFCNLIKTQFDKNVKIFRSNNGTKFFNHKFEKFTKTNGIRHQTTCVYTLQKNNIAETKHKHLMLLESFYSCKILNFLQNLKLMLNIEQ